MDRIVPPAGRPVHSSFLPPTGSAGQQKAGGEQTTQLTVAPIPVGMGRHEGEEPPVYDQP
jgi:hypothetical protein